MNILLTGASGFIGSQLAMALTLAGHHVKAASRRNGVDFQNMQSPESWAALLEGVDAVINSVGIIGEHGKQRFDVLHNASPSALFRACARAGVRRVIQISALGADPTAFSAYHRSKLAADDCLRERDLDWFVLRPSLVWGPGASSAALFHRMAALPIIPVIGNGQQAMQPVHVEDLVATVLVSLGADRSRQTLDVVGADVTTFAEWLQLLRQSRGRGRALIVGTPFALAMAGSVVARHFNPMMHPDNLRMLQRGSTSEVGPLALFLGRMPLGVLSPRFFTERQ